MDLKNGASVVIYNNIYLLGGYYSLQKFYKITLLEDNSITINNLGKITIKLTKLLISNFNNASMYMQDKKLNYPVYYGDGEKWNLVES